VTDGFSDSELDGLYAHNVIYLEPVVMDALTQFYEDAKEAAQRIRQKDALETQEP
jgi:hypothetical protein